MNDETIEDLKQFIAAAVRQEASGVREDIRSVAVRLGSLEKKVDDGFTSLADALTGAHDQLDDHETRITKLENLAV